MGWQIAEKVAIYQPIIYCVYKLVYKVSDLNYFYI